MSIHRKCEESLIHTMKTNCVGGEGITMRRRRREDMSDQSITGEDTPDATTNSLMGRKTN